MVGFRHSFFSFSALVAAAGVVLALCSACGSTDRAAPAEETPDAAAPPADAAPEPSPLVVARPYAVTKPSRYDGTTAVPLVVLLHGRTATAKLQDGYFKLSELAEERNFLVALPDGTTDQKGVSFWNAGAACCDFDLSGVDDLAYLTAVIADMKAQYNVDPKRVYLVGHSNGGFMAHTLACALSSEIAGIVSLAGPVSIDPAKCTPTDPVAVLQVHGDRDITIFYEGGVTGMPDAYPSAKTSIGTWAAKNGCDDTLAEDGTTLDIEPSIAGAETVVARHACTKGAAELWTIVGGGHIPELAPTWAARIYEFLEAHPKP